MGLQKGYLHSTLSHPLRNNFRPLLGLSGGWPLTAWSVSPLPPHSSLDSNHWRPGIKPFTSQPVPSARPSFSSSAHIPACSDRGRSHTLLCTYRSRPSLPSAPSPVPGELRPLLECLLRECLPAPLPAPLLVLSPHQEPVRVDAPSTGPGTFRERALRLGSGPGLGAEWTGHSSSVGIVVKGVGSGSATRPASLLLPWPQTELTAIASPEHQRGRCVSLGRPPRSPFSSQSGEGEAPGQPGLRVWGQGWYTQPPVPQGGRGPGRGWGGLQGAWGAKWLSRKSP